MKSRTVLVKAIASGVAVANIYYAQPVLVEIAHTFGVGPKDVGLVAVAIQVGYALGILFFVPFGDIAERRTLCVGLAAVSVIAMTVCALAPSLLVLGIAGCIAGVTSITAQILIPFAADLATPEKRGRVIAQVQTGVIMGIIFARVAGGFIGGNFGWRTVFWFGAAASAFATIAMWRALPRHQGHNRLTYPQLLASLAPLVREHRGLRVSCALGFCAFATFSAFWTTVPFHLASMGLGPAFVGSLGLTAMIGAFVAVNVGTFADKYGSVATGAFALVMLGIAWTIYWSGANVAWFFVVGAIVFAIGMQSNQISNQSRIFALDDSARSRLNTTYMFVTVSGGAVGSYVGAVAWQWWNWTGVCATAFAFIACAALVLARFAATPDEVPSRQRARSLGVGS